MKVRTVLLSVLCVVSFTNLLTESRAAITGQWDFKAGDLAATIGQDMSYLDPTHKRALLSEPPPALPFPTSVDSRPTS